MSPSIPFVIVSGGAAVAFGEPRDRRQLKSIRPWRDAQAPSQESAPPVRRAVLYLTGDGRDRLIVNRYYPHTP
eukprot:6069099-Prymnesium_polylepis.1